MQKDNQPSKKYTDDEFTMLDIPYKYRDFCQDDLADYISCIRVHPSALANKFVYMLPLSEYYTYCKPLLHQWEKCQKYRDSEVFEKMRGLIAEMRNKD